MEPSLGMELCLALFYFAAGMNATNSLANTNGLMTSRKVHMCRQGAQVAGTENQEVSAVSDDIMAGLAAPSHINENNIK